MNIMASEFGLVSAAEHLVGGQLSYLHLGIDTVRDLVSELARTGVRLGQQEGI